LLPDSKKAAEILATPAQEHHAMFSPDGKWLAYASNALGAQEIYIRPYPITQGTERRVSEGGGAGPVWAPDGSELYYRAAKSIMAVGRRSVPGSSLVAPTRSSQASDSDFQETRRPLTSIPTGSSS
jgi:Tol biopolymer transport system component